MVNDWPAGIEPPAAVKNRRKEVNIDEDNYAINHYTWRNFKLTDEQISKHW